MKCLKGILIIGTMLFGVAWGQFNIGNVPFEEIEISPERGQLIKKLWETSPLNLSEINQELNLSKILRYPLFSTHNPYHPSYIESYDSLDDLKFPLPTNPLSYILRKNIKRIKYYAQEVVVAWEANPNKNRSVCAVQFTDALQKSYLLKTFPSKEAAKNADYIITHFGRCGMCSSLKDLAVYLAKPDLTAPARKCTKKLDTGSIKSCYQHELGFSSSCSEQWAYSSEQTLRQCGNTCIQFYGLLNMMRNTMDRPNTDEDGNLNVCLACDEYKSGPGFRYGVGRNRRNSGITSAINRDNSEIFDVDHYRYFED